MKSVCACVLTIAALIHGPCLKTVSAEGFPVAEIVNGLYVHEGVHEQMSVENLGAIGNSGFIIGTRSVAVIDPGGSPQAGQLLRSAIRSVTDLPIKYLIFTHFHPDHVAGAVAFKDVENIIAHENYARAISQRAQFYLDRFTQLLPGSVEETFVLPRMTVAVGATLDIDLGERILTIEAHQLAHTDNDITVHDQRSNTLWASDLLFAQRTPSLDGSLIGWSGVLRKLAAREYALAVPGHGKPAVPSELIRPHIHYLEQLEDDVRTMIAEGIALSKVLEDHELNVATDNSWKLFATQHGSNLAKAYSELEWE